METEAKGIQIRANEGAVKSIPWKDGYYRLTGMTTNVFVVNGEKVHVEDVTNQGSDDDPMSNGTWTFGDFGNAPSEVAKYTGKQNSDVDISMWGGVWATKGVICDEGRRIAVWSITNELAFFEKIQKGFQNCFSQQVTICNICFASFYRIDVVPIPQQICNIDFKHLLQKTVISFSFLYNRTETKH